MLHILAVFHFVIGFAGAFAVQYFNLPWFVNPTLCGLLLLFLFVQKRTARLRTDTNREEMLRELIDRLIVEKRQTDRRLLMMEQKFRRKSVF